MAKDYGLRPSQIISRAFANDWVDWQFDRACLLLGRTVDNRLKEKNKDGSPKYKTLDAALRLTPKTVGSIEQFMMLFGG